MAANNTFEEIECKFLEVDVAAVTAKLEKAGAKKQFTKLYKRYTFDFPDLRLAKDFAWLRIRDEGDRVTVTYKQRQGVQAGQNDSGMKEIETTVGDFEVAAELLRAIGMKPKFYEENRRIAYMLDGVEVVIDQWPLIPAYVEVEGESWEAVEAVSVKLGFDFDTKFIFSTMQVYERYCIDEMSYDVLTFEKQVKKPTHKA